MKCAHCGQPIQGAAYVDGARVLHADCTTPYRAAKHGRTHKCPECKGSGWEYDRDVHEAKGRAIDDGTERGAWETYVESRHERKRCDFCDGHGYLATKPEPIIEPARVVGWRKP